MPAPTDPAVRPPTTALEATQGEQPAEVSSGNLTQFSEGLGVQARIISALIIRNLMMRYGRANIGFLWAVLEPMILTSGVMLVWSALKSPYEHGLPILAIVLTGYMPLTLYRHLTGMAPMLLSGSVSFLYHRHISLLDVILARAFLEFVATSGALLTVYIMLLVFDLIEPVADPGLAAAAWVIMGVFSFGMATLIAVVTEHTEVAEKLIQPMQYLQLPISGSFFMVSWLPKKAQDLIWYNPIVHCYEMFRAGFFGESVLTFYTPWYPLAAGLTMAAIGLSRLNRVRDELRTG